MTRLATTAALIAAVALTGCGYEPAGAADENGGRNGVTEFRDKWGRVCTAVQPFQTSGEVALDCDWPSS